MRLPGAMEICLKHTRAQSIRTVWLDRRPGDNYLVTHDLPNRAWFSFVVPAGLCLRSDGALARRGLQ